ncbi:MAG TPA: glycerol-3-phosphate dehydrogenase/oxidase [Actinomycetes bacterium]
MRQEASTSARLGPQERQAALARMAEEVFDVVVVGGGVTGAGTALDAATRGLSVALVEAVDFAAGTSSRSSKLIHGGLRYLEQLNFTLVREALQERGLLLTRLAPHLVRPVSFLYPLRHRYWERFYVEAGVLLYDTMGGARALPWHRHLSRRAALALAPSLRPDALVGAIRYYDGQVDDARHTLVTARTAARFGALLATSARATRFLRDGERVTGIRVHDLESGRDLEVRACQVVSATGIWTDELTEQVGGAPYRVRMSKGIHFTVPAERIDSGTGLILRTEKSVLFVIPWGHHWIIGTTDTDWDLDRDEPAATEADIDYLLDHVNRVLTDPLGRADIESVYVGLRPLLAGGSASTAQLSREHAVFRPAPGLVAVAGGKYTTYRVMAKDTMDEVARGLEEETGLPVPPSVTADTPLLGADGCRAAWNRRARIAARSGLDVVQVEHLLHRHGTTIDEVLALLAESPELAQPLPGAEEYLAAEAVYAASHEGALHLDDVLVRRTRIAMEAADRGLAAATPVSRYLAAVLGWTEDQRLREVDSYRSRVQAERAAETQPDDQSANTARRQATGARALHADVAARG